MAVYKRKGSPYYQYEFVLNGRTYRRSTGTTSRREAEAAERQAKADARAGASERDGVSVEGILERYWLEIGQHTKNRQTIKTYLARIADLLGPSRPIGDIGGDEVSAMVATLREAGLAVGTVQNHVFALRAAHGRAQEVWGVPVKQIAWRRLGLRRPAPTHSVLTPKQADALLRALPLKTRLLIAWLLATGMRLSQALTLHGRQIDLEKSCVTITRQKQRAEGKLQVIPLTPMASQVIASRLQLGPIEPHALVFDATNFRPNWRRAIQAAGVPHARIHDLRHTFATWLGQRGARIEHVSQLLGHSSLQITMRYREVFQAELGDAASRLPTLQDLGSVGTHTVDRAVRKPLKTKQISATSPVETPRRKSADDAAEPPEKEE